MMSSNSSVPANTTVSSSDVASNKDGYPYPKKLFVNVAPSTTCLELTLLMEEFGQVRSVYFPTNHRNDSGCGFAFVIFRWHEDAAAAMKGLDGHGFDGLVLHPRWATNDNKKKKPTTHKKRNSGNRNRNGSQ